MMLQSRKTTIWAVRNSAIFIALAAGLSGTADAQQFDEPYYELQREHSAKWADEDTVIDAKLAELNGEFGKRPNIIYILADDIGFGELGWQGGGKHRGTPSPTIK